MCQKFTVQAVVVPKKPASILAMILHGSNAASSKTSFSRRNHYHQRAPSLPI
jgi:hypothetical protein